MELRPRNPGGVRLLQRRTPPGFEGSRLSVRRVLTRASLRGELWNIRCSHGSHGHDLHGHSHAHDPSHGHSHSHHGHSPAHGRSFSHSNGRSADPRVPI